MLSQPQNGAVGVCLKVEITYDRILEKLYHGQKYSGKKKMGISIKPTINSPPAFPDNEVVNFVNFRVYPRRASSYSHVQESILDNYH